jgi:DNA-binding NarL/FixJ family response regulator
MTNRDIARARGSSENTVANQLKSISRKRGVQSRIDLVRLLT